MGWKRCKIKHIEELFQKVERERGREGERRNFANGREMC